VGCRSTAGVRFLSGLEFVGSRGVAFTIDTRRRCKTHGLYVGGAMRPKGVRFARLTQASQAGGAFLQRNLIINLTRRDRRAGRLERRTTFKRACAAGVREAGARLYERSVRRPGGNEQLEAVKGAWLCVGRAASKGCTLRSSRAG